MPVIALSGSWTYRSFINNPSLVNDDAQAALNLIFGEGVLHVVSIDESNFKAVLDFGGGAAMDLFGTVVHACGYHPQVIEITGTGREGTSTAQWVYQYKGYIVPTWPQGVKQVPAIVGTVVRTIPHGAGQAGVVASFVAVQQA
jgi:hypothetical protein